MICYRTAVKLAASIALAIPAMAAAKPAVSLDSAVYVERGTTGAGRTLEPARQLTRGDRVVYVMRWQRRGDQGGFVVTNPLSPAVAYQGSASGEEEVSIDGGRSWGKLGALRLNSRLATPEDVTHVRWRVAPAQAAQGSGRIAYSAIVR